MTCRNVIGAERAGTLEQRRELQVAVAVHARKRRAPIHVLTHEVRDDLLVELALEVHDVVRNTDGGGDAPSVVQVVERAAAAESVPGTPVPLVVELHRDANRLDAVRRNEGGRD